MPRELHAFDHVHVFVTNRPAAVDWYRQVIGLLPSPDFAFWASDGGPLTLQNASGSVHIALFERPSQPCRSTIALRVDATSFKAWRAHLNDMLPGAVSEEDHTVSRSLYFRDPDGNPYEITTYEVAALGRG